MRYYVVKYAAFSIIFNLVLCHGVGISSKLDLDGLKSSSKLIESIDRHRPLAYKYTTNGNDKASDGTESIGVICVSAEGCNTTQSIKSKSKDSIETDVVVHVKTSIEHNNSKDVVDDTPDIPVIIGTSDRNHDHVNDNNQYLVRPVISTNDDDGIISITPTPVLDFPQQSFIPSGLDSPKVYIQKTTPSTSNILNIESLISDNQGRSVADNRYNPNTVDIYVPHFESSYHSHYFGENPPPQVVWFSKPKVTAKPSLWSGRDFIPTSQRRIGTVGSEVGCSCKNHVSPGVGRGISTGLQWYPSRGVYNSNPGSRIDDKLAPLD